MKISVLFLALLIPFASASGKGKGKGKGGKGGGSGNPCDICKDGRPDSITFKYVPADPSAHMFEKHTCADYMYPASATISVTTGNDRDLLFSATVINDGDTFTVNGPFEANSYFEFAGVTGLDDGGNSCIVHTSCSDELLPGYENRIGPFEIVGDECIPAECDVCDQGRPDVLFLKYHSAGMTSMHQPFDKADCVAGTYPIATTLTVKDKNNNVLETITGVTDQMEFSIGNGYSLEAETHFDIAGWVGGSCFIHTSCSVPLIPGDIIGAFEVIEGNDCAKTESECVKPDKTSYACGEAITIDWDMSQSDPNDPDFAGSLPHNPMRDDWIGIYPCNESLDAIFHAQVWQWTCGTIPSPNNNLCVPTGMGSMVFDSLPPYNSGGPHSWPVPAGCWKAILLRNDGPSVPPYVPICESMSFDVTGIC